MLDSLSEHLNLVVNRIVAGKVIPFFGAGVNLCDRQPGMGWQQGRNLPSGGELAAYLAQSYRYPSSDVHDLLRVSQYVDVVAGTGTLYEELRKVLDADYPPTTLHRFFATLPAVLREKGYSPRYQPIVTTNYDDLLEHAFRAAGEPFDLMSYIAEGEHSGRFLHQPHEGEARLIDRPNEYPDLVLDRHTLILKIHGAIDRIDPERDSYVVTEDHYIDYLTRADISMLLPVRLVAQMKQSHFLFLGYSLRDWNLRVLLYRIWRNQKLDRPSWAVQLGPEPMDAEFWQRRQVRIFDVSLEEYIAALSRLLQGLPRAGGGE